MKNAMLILALALGVSACGGSGGGGGLPPPPPAAPLEDTFGAGFGATFRADPNSNPRDPAAGDIVPVDPTKDATGVP